MSDWVRRAVCDGCGMRRKCIRLTKVYPSEGSFLVWYCLECLAASSADGLLRLESGVGYHR